MLNELLEFEQYTYDLTAEMPVIRLKHKTICNSLSGTARAMTIIARWSYYNQNNSIAQVKNDLQAWCGDPRGKSEEASKDIKESWLPSYMISILEKEKANLFNKYLDEIPQSSKPKHYDKIKKMFKDIQDELKMTTFQDKSKRDKYMDDAKMLRLYCKELDEDKGQLRESSGKYAPIYRIINALNDLNGRFGTKGYNVKLFNNNLNKPEKNDYKKITYDKIIADAITVGPLVHYYLVCKEADFSNLFFKTDKSTKYPFKKKVWSEPTKSKEDVILKTVAAFLLEQNSRRIKDEEVIYKGFAPVNLTDISNWLKGNTGVEKLKQFGIEEQKESGIETRPLFKLEAIDNVATISIDSAWMKKCGWKIISEDKMEEHFLNNSDDIVYVDRGAGQYLEKMSYKNISNNQIVTGTMYPCDNCPGC